MRDTHKYIVNECYKIEREVKTINNSRFKKRSTEQRLQSLKDKCKRGFEKLEELSVYANINNVADKYIDLIEITHENIINYMIDETIFLKRLGDKNEN